MIDANFETPSIALTQEEVYQIRRQMKEYEINIGLVYVEIKKNIDTNEDIGMLISIIGKGCPKIEFNIEF